MDRAIYRWVNRLADNTSWAHGAFTLYAGAGIALFAVFLFVAFLNGRQHDDPLAVAAAIWAGAAAIIALGIGQVIGGAFDRLRPYESMSDVHVLVARSTDFSFPSDHATVAGAVAMGLLLANRRWGFVAAIAAVLMALTRVYVGAHYPGDVLAGLALGAAVAAVGHTLIVQVLRRAVSKTANSALRPLVTARSNA